MRKPILRALLIVLAGLALGLVGNALSPRGIPLITPPKTEPKAEEFIPLPQAKELWSSGAAIFLDAREPDDYVAGHIGNAFNLPALSFEKHFGKVAPMLTPNSQVVVYCDGMECTLSHHLAETLKRMSFTNVHILQNGWTAWKQAGLPTQQGAAQ